MAQFFEWFVLLHIVGLVIFIACHGVSMFVAFRIRAQRDPRAIAAGLEASSAAIGPMYLGLLLLIVGGLGAAAGGDLWSETWIIASAIVFVAVIVAMYAMATPYYKRVREAVGAQVGGKPPEGQPASAEELATLLDTRRPELLLVVGGVGLLALLWLMVLRPTL